MRLVFDEEGDVDTGTISDLSNHVRDDRLTDVVLFSHGWNNDEAAATSLYDRWFGLLGAHLDPARRVGFVGLRWPAQLWRDEPIPDFGPSPADGGGAGLDATPLIAAGEPTLDPRVLDDLKDLFPTATRQLDTIAELLAAPPTDATAKRLFAAMRKFSSLTATGFNDGEARATKHPGMLRASQDPAAVFGMFADRLASTGVDLGGDAGFDVSPSKLLHGAKEALRQLSYWKMKNRAGVVGQRGLGPVITGLADQFGSLRVHLVGHSFGARLVSYALAGLGDRQPSPVKSLTLLQGAYSRFAFTDALPFRSGSGGLAGRLARVNGPLSVCFSGHDRALGTFYPLASAAVGDDAGLDDPLMRWRAMGSDGAFDVHPLVLGPVGTRYPFAPSTILNLDASGVVFRGDSPSGAHSDIFHPELAWVAAAGGSLAGP
jgi:hypothetical protein